jgi:hypothetical protein
VYYPMGQVLFYLFLGKIKMVGTVLHLVMERGYGYGLGGMDGWVDVWMDEWTDGRDVISPDSERLLARSCIRQIPWLAWQ